MPKFVRNKVTGGLFAANENLLRFAEENPNEFEIVPDEQPQDIVEEEQVSEVVQSAHRRTRRTAVEKEAA